MAPSAAAARIMVSNNAACRVESLKWTWGMGFVIGGRQFPKCGGRCPPGRDVLGSVDAPARTAGVGACRTSAVGGAVVLQVRSPGPRGSECGTGPRVGGQAAPDAWLRASAGGGDREVDGIAVLALAAPTFASLSREQRLVAY